LQPHGHPYCLKAAASVIKKVVEGNASYYLATSARVDGKPRIVEQRYPGTADETAQAVDGATRTPSRSRHPAFGDPAAARHVIEKLRAAEAADGVAGPGAATRAPRWAPTQRRPR
jgi:hypothetical protein